jgi:hypothetical protein
MKEYIRVYLAIIILVGIVLFLKFYINIEPNTPYNLATSPYNLYSTEKLQQTTGKSVKCSDLTRTGTSIDNNTGRAPYKCQDAVIQTSCKWIGPKNSKPGPFGKKKHHKGKCVPGTQTSLPAGSDYAEPLWPYATSEDWNELGNNCTAAQWDKIRDNQIYEYAKINSIKIPEAVTAIAYAHSQRHNDLIHTPSCNDSNIDNLINGYTYNHPRS